MLGVVIVNYKTWKETIECVKSIFSTSHLEIKIYIVDNHSENGSYERLNEEYSVNDNVVVMKSNENGGYAKGNNIGIRACRKNGIRYIIITNNDIIFKENCINHMYEVINNGNNIVQLAPKVVGKSGELLSPPWSGQQTLLQYLHLNRQNEFIMKEDELQGLVKVYMVPGGCFMIDSDKFTEMGAFDENTFLYNEEGIISVKAKRAGYDIMYDSNAVVIHNHGASTEKGTLFSDTEIVKSGLYYWKNYEDATRIQLLFIYVFMVVRMTVKVCVGRAKVINFRRYMRECWASLVNVLK